MSDHDIAIVQRALDGLGAQVPTVRALTHGPDIGIRDGNAAYGLVVDFDGPAGWEAYSKHPSHDGVRDLLARLVESQSVVQFWVQEP